MDAIKFMENDLRLRLALGVVTMHLLFILLLVVTHDLIFIETCNSILTCMDMYSCKGPTIAGLRAWIHLPMKTNKIGLDRFCQFTEN
jgi:hypothetical protein